MFGTVISAVAGAVVGGVVNGVTAYRTTMENAKSYRKAAEDIDTANKMYSGTEAYNKIRDTGISEGSEFGRIAGETAARPNFINQNPGGAVPQMAEAVSNGNNAAEAADHGYNSGQQLGMDNMNSALRAKYNAATVGAQQAMKQSDIDYNVANQTAQTALQGAAGVAGTYNQLRSRNGREIQ